MTIQATLDWRPFMGGMRLANGQFCNKLSLQLPTRPPIVWNSDYQGNDAKILTSTAYNIWWSQCTMNMNGVYCTHYNSCVCVYMCVWHSQTTRVESTVHFAAKLKIRGPVAQAFWPFCPKKKHFADTPGIYLESTLWMRIFLLPILARTNNPLLIVMWFSIVY